MRNLNSVTVTGFPSCNYAYVFFRHGAHAPGVRINPGHSEHDGSGGPLPAGAEHAGGSWSFRTRCLAVCSSVARQERRPPDPLARKTLTLLLSICLPSLFLILTGADHMTPQRRKQEVRGRLLWVVVDLLDVLDLQAGLWEAQGGAAAGTGGSVEQKLPIWVEGLVFFYCYALLLLLPCVALTELGATGLPGQRGPHKEALYPWLSLVTINIFTLALRGMGMLWYRDPRVSTVFLGKNLLALAVKLSSAWERHKQERAAAGAGSVVGAEPGDSTLPSQSSEQGEAQAQGKAPYSHYHTLSHSQSHTLSHVSLEPTETPFISHEL
uniref:transmembrane protein 121 isoform X2 n=1 Tax=Monopterus albus TaxID=43700 RepID=UPI0009B46288|nr:transmembrane protein 121-like isoform X2 [Monopterus albus]